MDYARQIEETRRALLDRVDQVIERVHAVQDRHDPQVIRCATDMLEVYKLQCDLFHRLLATPLPREERPRWQELTDRMTRQLDQIMIYVGRLVCTPDERSDSSNN
jgi:hypothetical protein